MDYMTDKLTRSVKLKRRSYEEFVKYAHIHPEHWKLWVDVAKASGQSMDKILHDLYYGIGYEGDGEEG